MGTFNSFGDEVANTVLLLYSSVTRISQRAGLPAADSRRIVWIFAESGFVLANLRFHFERAEVLAKH